MHRIALFALVLLAACTPKTIDGQTRRPKPPLSPIDVYVTKMPDRPYTEIAVLSVKEDTLNEATEFFQVKARKLGGDAVIITQQGPRLGQAGAVVIVYDRPSP